MGTETAGPEARQRAGGALVAQQVTEPLGRRFTVHLGGVCLANLVDGLLLGAVPLIAITLTRSPAQISLLQVAFWLPWLLLGIVAGLIVDRGDRRHIQLIGVGVRMLALAVLTAAAFTGRLSMPLLIAVVAVYGITQVFVDLAAGTIVPTLVPRSRLSAANGRTQAAEHVFTNFLGAPIAGVLVVLGTGWFGGVALGLCAAFLVLIGLGLRGNHRVARPTEAAAGAEIAEGLGFLLRHRVLRPLMITAGVMNMASAAFFGLFVLWAVGEGSRLELEPQHFPMLLALVAVGAVVGSLICEKVLSVVREVPLMLICLSATGALMLIPVLVPRVGPIMVAFFLLGLVNMIGNAISATVRQRLVPAGLLGRVGGAARTLAFGLTPLGALIGGQTAERVGLAPVLVGAAILSMLSVLYPILTVRQSMLVDDDSTQRTDGTEGSDGAGGAAAADADPENPRGGSGESSRAAILCRPQDSDMAGQDPLEDLARSARAERSTRL